jgi:hypothetical protein
MAASLCCGADVPVQPLSVRVSRIVARPGPLRRTRALIAAAMVAIAAPAFAEEGSSRLTPGAVLSPSLVPPGWVADHVASWIVERAAYAATCQTDEVARELRYLEKLVDRDQDLRDTARAQLLHAVVEGNSAAKRHTDVAADALAPLDNDITVIDRLLVMLTALPDCASASATAATTPVPAPPPQQPLAARVPAPEPQSQPTAAPVSSPDPQQAAEVHVLAMGTPEQATPPAPQPQPPPAAAAETAAAPVPRAPAPEPPAAAPRDDNLFIVRFDSKLLGLTPSGIRALDAALRAADAGRPVRIAIEGCEDRDTIPEGVDCTDRTQRLKRILADRGVDHPAQLIAAPR